MPVQLQHLAQAYFHQDYDLDFGTPDDVIAGFAEGEGPGAVRELISEIDTLLTSPGDQAQLADLWIRALGAAYDPSASGQTQREWLVHVRDLLANAQDSGETDST
jgi:hypothetical protein